MKQTHSRRHFIKTTALVTGSLVVSENSCSAAAQNAEKPNKKMRQLHLGLASYTCRKLSLEETVEMAAQADLTYLCLKSMHLPLDSSPEKIRRTRDIIREAGLQLYAGGVIYMKNAQQTKQAFDYAKASGMSMIVGVPSVELLDMTEEYVQQTGISLAIHNHGPTDKLYPHPEVIYAKLKGRDKRMGLCVDISHTMRCNIEPAEAVRRCGDRILDLHMRDNASEGPRPKYTNVGRGIIDIPALLTALDKVGYNGVLAMELEHSTSNLLPDLTESAGYLRGVQAGLQA